MRWTDRYWGAAGDRGRRRGSPGRWSPTSTEIFPRSAASLNAIMGAGTASYIWLCNEASGGITDSVAGQALTEIVAPSYGNATVWAGETAIGFTDATDGRLLGPDSSFLNPGTNSYLGLMVFKFTAAGATRTLLSNFAANTGFRWRFLASGEINIQCGDGTAQSVSTSAGSHIDGGWHTAIIGVDRSTTEIIIETDIDTANRATLTQTGSHTTTGDTLTLGSTAPPSVLLAYLAWFQGANAEGITTTHRGNLHTHLGLS